jgi:tetratricopeptide (TPR) repeat protein
MFFPKLRRRAKWVFLLLAIVFAGGFLVFGVGTGVQGTSIGDVIQDIFGSGGGSDQPSIDSAREKLSENPRDADAQLELANALQAAGQRDAAIAALVRYTELRPRDVDGLQQLASLYTLRAQEAQQRALAIQADAQSDLFGQQLRPGGDLGQALSDNPIDHALAAEANARFGEASAAVQREYGRVATIYQELTLLEPDEPNIFLQLGQASQLSGDAQSAIVAYQKFLELSPDDANAPIVRQQLEQLGVSERNTEDSG